MIGADKPLIKAGHAAMFLLAARLGMASLFVFSGLEKLLDYRGAVGFAKAFAIPFADYTIWGAILLELGCAAALLTRRFCRQGAAVLVVWTLLLNPWFHRFWSVPDAMWQMMIDNFFHAFVMAGGLMYVVVFGAGERR